MKKLIIFGTGSFAEVAYFYFTHDSDYEVVAFCAHKSSIIKDELFGLPVLPFEDIQKEYSPTEYVMFIAVGYVNMNSTRAMIFDQAKKQGYQLISYVNSKVTKWEELDMGENCFIFENNVIQPFVKIGNDVILWSGNHVGHHSKIGDHCWITSHVVISGNAKIESYCFLGVNATIRDGITIAEKCLIGAGAIILEDTKKNQVFAANKPELLSVDSESIKHI